MNGLYSVPALPPHRYSEAPFGLTGSIALALSANVVLGRYPDNVAQSAKSKGSASLSGTRSIKQGPFLGENRTHISSTGRQRSDG